MCQPGNLVKPAVGRLGLIVRVAALYVRDTPICACSLSNAERSVLTDTRLEVGKTPSSNTPGHALAAVATRALRAGGSGVRSRVGSGMADQLAVGLRLRQASSART